MSAVPADNDALRARLIEVSRGMNRRGINVNKSGNASVRALSDEGVEGMLITPTGVPYEALDPEDLVFVPFGKEPSLEGVRGRRLPSSEWEMHERVYHARPDAGGIVHTHSCFATALACRNEPIPAFHYMVAVAGGDSIGVVPYATFGSSELARLVAEGVRERHAALLEHHGVIALGATPEKALDLAAEVENLAHQYVVVRQLGNPRLIPAEEMRRVVEKFRTYGQPLLREGVR